MRDWRPLCSSLLHIIIHNQSLDLIHFLKKMVNAQILLNLKAYNALK